MKKYVICLLLLIVLPLGGCGIRPEKLEPPPGAENTTFPNIYPDPATDPVP